MHCIRLPDSADAEGWRSAARALLRAGVPPAEVAWQVEGCEADALFDDEPALPEAAADAPRPAVPAAFVELATDALCHTDPQRFALLYRLLWRLVHEPGLRHDRLDPDWLAVRTLARAVHRDEHQMRAFVRFHEQATPQGPQFVAWYEPEHHVVDRNAPFFAGRFASMRWAIFTPRRSVAWDGRALQFGGGAQREAVLPKDDAKQALWLTYYASIFNPARLKLEHMQGEMPKKYWRNLPEAALIAPLAADAARRTERMIHEAPTMPRRRIPRKDTP